MSDDLPEFREREALAPEEKETIIKFGKDGEARIFSEHRGICSRLLQHPEVEVGRVTLAGGSRCEDVDALDGSDTITAVKATAPVGVLKIQASARATTGLADVVSEGVLGGAQ